MKLTDKESQLVADNERLIYWIAGIKGLDLEDWYGDLAIELCKTVRKYNNKKGSLSNYYKLRVDSLVGKEYRKSKTMKNLHNGLVDLDEALLEEDFNVEGYVEPELHYAIQELFNGEYGDLIRLKYEGYNQIEIAEKLGISQSQVSKILKRVRDEFYD